MYVKLIARVVFLKMCYNAVNIGKDQGSSERKWVSEDWGGVEEKEAVVVGTLKENEACRRGQ